MQYIWCIYAWQAWESAVEATTKINLQVKPRLSVPHLRSNNATIWETGLKGSRGSNPVHNTTCKSFNPSVDWLLLLLLWLLTTAGHAAKGEKCKAQKERRKKKEQKRFGLKRFQSSTHSTIGIFFVSPDHLLAIIQLHQNSHKEVKPCGLASLL